MKYTYENNSKLNIGYFDLKKYLKYLTPNEQAFIISEYGRNMSYEKIMEKFNLNLFEFNIIKNTAQLKMTMLMARNLLPYQAREVEEIKKVVYPELTEEEYDCYIWDENEDLTKDYYAGKFDKELKGNRGKSKMDFGTKEVKEQTTETEITTGTKEIEVKIDKRRKPIQINEESKQKIIEHLKYFKPIEQLTLIYTYMLFGEDNLTTIGIAARFNLTLGRISQIKKSVTDKVDKYVLNNNGEEYFKNLESKGNVYKPLTQDNYLDFDQKLDVSKEKSFVKEEIKEELAQPIKQKEQETVEDRQDIIDILKYFTKAEQICLVYGYGLFGVKKGDKVAMTKHFRKDFDINSVFTKTVRKKRLLSKPIENMNEQEYFLYQQIISNEYEVNGESFYNKNNKSLENGKNKVIKNVDNTNTLLQDKNKLTYLPLKIQYVILANYGFYGDKLTLTQIAKNLGYGQLQVGRYKSYGEMCLKLLNTDPKNMNNEEIDQYNDLLKSNYGVLTKEEYVKFPETFERKVKDSNAPKDQTKDKRKSRKNVLPEYFEIDDLIHFQPKFQVMMYLVYGLEGVKQYALLKVAEAINCNYNTLSKSIASILEEIKILHTPYEELDDEKKKTYDSLINKRYLQITKHNLYEYMPNKNSEIYFEEKGSTL